MKSEPYFDIICIAQPSWEGPYAKSTVLLMKELALHNRVLYVDYASTWKDLLQSLFKKKYVSVFQMLGWKDRLRVINKIEKEITLAVLTLPPMFPSNFLSQGFLYRLLSKINGWTAGVTIRKAMKRISFSSPVVVNAFSPAMGAELIDKLNERLTIYYCYDEIKEADWSGKHGRLMEEEFAKKVDGVIVSSDSLGKEKASLNKNIFIVKNGVDAKAFQPSNTGRQVENTRARIGFVGSLDSRIDYQLLHELIARSPEWQFQFIGRVVDAQFEAIRVFSNVEWIAPIAYNSLPKLIEGFDLGIIPFLKSPFTEKIYPLKINEYLAMGKPVVMTSFARLSEFDSMVVRADSGAEFKAAILSALNHDTIAKHGEREIFARKNSWEERAKEFGQVIETIDCEKR